MTMIQTLLVKRFLVITIRTENLEQMEYVMLAQQGINLMMQTLLVKRFLVVTIRTENLEQMGYVQLVQLGIN